MSVLSRKSKLSALLVASLISVNFVCAGDAYKNNVVDVRVNKESGDSVKVTIFTDRPYTEPVVVNKKANNKYVILMPETKSTLKAAPSVTNGSGTISNVSVNTQSVAGGKGYTKIIITSEKAITVVPRTQQLVSSTPKTVSKPIPKSTTQSKPVVKQQPVQKKPVQAIAQKPVKQVSQPKPVQTQKPAPKPAPKPTIAQKEPIQVLEQEVKTGEYANIPPEKNDEVLDKEIKNNTSSETKQEIAVNTDTQNTSVISGIKSVLKGYKNIGLWKLLLLAGAITFPIIVIMIILTLDKKINKKIDTTLKREEEIDYIPEDSVVQPADDVQTYDQPVYNSFDEMLNKVDEPETTYHEEQLAHTEFEEFSQALNEHSSENLDFLPKDSVNRFNNDFVSDDFETGAESEINNDVTQVSENNENIIVEPEVVEEVVETEPEVQLPAEPYNPDGYIADFAGAGVNGINDKDFFDELVMQTMADNNRDGLPQESPADEVFNYLGEDKTVENIKPEPQQEDADNQVSDPVQEFINETNTKEQPSEESSVQTYVNGDDELTMLTEVKLNDSTGLYLVNYDNFSSLVGHINDDYFVIKKFDEIVTGKIFLKETEKLKDSKRYLVRVGKNKMVVEVSDTSMDRLLDL